MWHQGATPACEYPRLLHARSMLCASIFSGANEVGRAITSHAKGLSRAVDVGTVSLTWGFDKGNRRNGGGEIWMKGTAPIDEEIVRLTHKKHPKLLFHPTVSSSGHALRPTRSPLHTSTIWGGAGGETV